MLPYADHPSLDGRAPLHTFGKPEVICVISCIKACMIILHALTEHTNEAMFLEENEPSVLRNDLSLKRLHLRCHGAYT